ncbi:MAG: hypothetical protein U9Q24_02295 [Candidatus Ratteibacteria bacterium]|nr:hypothetical protein [Candidatus Ratteibacteria bacterium]
MVDERILNTEETRILASYWNESRRFYDIPRKNIGKKHQDFAEYYRATAASE